MGLDNSETKNQNEVGWQNELEKRFVKIRTELNELSNPDVTDDSVEIAEKELDWKFAEFLLNYQNWAQFDKLKQDVNRLRNWDLSHLWAKAWKWLNQLYNFLEDIWKSDMEKYYNKFMEKIKNPGKLNSMTSAEVRRLNLFLWMHEDKALSAYKEMKNIFWKFVEKWMTGQDVTFFNDVWNTLKSNYSASDLFIAEDYWALNKSSDLKELTDKLWDFFPRGKWFWKWDGRNIVEQWLPDKVNSIVSKSKVVEKFNALNEARTNNNKNIVSNINIKVDDLNKFTKKDGELLYEWGEFNVSKMVELFWDQVNKLAWEWTDFVDEEEMNRVIDECKDGIFAKLKNSILQNVQEEVSDSDDVVDNVSENFEASKDSFKANQNLKDRIKELGFYDWNEEWENVKFNITKVKEYLDTLKDKTWEDLKSLGALDKQAWIISVQIALNYLNSKDWNYKDSCNVEWLDGIYMGKTASWVEWFQNKYNVDKSDNEKLKPDKLPWPKTITAIIAELSNLLWGSNTWVESSEDVDEELKEPEISFNWDLWQIKEDWEKKTGSDGLFNWLTREQQEVLDADKDLYKTMNNISTQLEDVKSLLNNEKLSPNENLKKLLEWFPKVLTVIDYPTKDNVRCLQKFISDNLVDSEKAVFDQLNKKDAGFDGSFWKSTLKWVNIVLEKTWKYISDMKEYLDKLILRDDVKIKNEVTVTKWWTLEEGAFIADDSTLPEWVNLNFEPKLEDVKTDAAADCNVKVIASKDNGGVEVKRETNVTVKVVDSTDNQPVTPDAPSETTTDPLNFEWGQHLVMWNSSNLADNLWLWWRAVFYSADVQDPPIEAQDGKWSTEQVPNNGDYVCYLQIDGLPDRTYQVKVDQNWNLCPVAINLSSKVSVEFENNKSCINYLYNKLPGVLRDKGVDISRRGSDYVIWMWKWKYLTIEPMTIANKWVWKDLTENLAFLNFTNYLRNERTLQDVELYNDNSNLKLEWNDLYVRVNKNSNKTYEANWAIKEMWKRLLVNKESFWLQDASNESLSNYIRYNNHERWNKNWDNDEKNKYYRKVRIS